MSNAETYCVYKHTNKINGKSYIGMTKDISQRWRSCGLDYKGPYGVFWKAIQKYGWDGFTHEILEDNLSFDEACEKERFYIKKYKTNISRKENIGLGYNLTDGGDGTQGRLMSEEEKQALSKRISGKGNPMYGKKLSEETRRKISEKAMGRFIGEKSPLYGTHPSEETRKKLRENHRDTSGGNNPRAKRVVCVETGNVYPTITEAVCKVGHVVNRHKLAYACENKDATAYGYHWRYA